MYHQIADSVHCYHGHCLPRRHCTCHLLAFLDTDAQAAIVVCTELGSNSGTSITNLAVELADDVGARLGQDPATFTWIERYVDPPRGGKPACERLSRVTFDVHAETWSLSNPHWTPITRQAVEELLGRPLPPAPEYSYP